MRRLLLIYTFVSLLWLAESGLVVYGSTPLPSQPTAFCQTNGRVHDLLLHQQVFYLAGEFTAVRPAGEPPTSSQAVARRGLAACDAITGAILPWSPTVTYTPTPADMTVHTLALDPTGMLLYLGGQFDQVNGQPRTNVAAVRLLDGAVTDWQPAVTRRVRDLLVNSAGNRIYLAGGNGLRAYHTADSEPSASFQVTVTDGAAQPASVYALALSVDGQTLYLAGGSFTQVNGIARTGAAAVDAATGRNVLPFAPDLRDTNPLDPIVQIYDLLLYDRHLYLCGDWWLTEGGVAVGGWGEADPNGRQANVGRFDPQSGAADRSWRPWTDGGVQGCDLDPLGQRLIIGGHFERAGGESQLVTASAANLPDLAAIDLVTGHPITPTWRIQTGATNFPQGVYPDVWAVTLAGGVLAIGGHFETIGATSQQGVAPFALPRTVLLVVGDPAQLTAGEQAIYFRLEQILGLRVRLVDDDQVSVDDTAGVDLVALSATVSATKLQTTFKPVAAPILVWQPWLYDDLGMTPTPESAFGTLVGQNATVVAATHPLAAGRSGSVALTWDAPRTISWGEPAATAQVIATMVETTTAQSRAVFFVYPRQALLADGTLAAGCRVALPMYQNGAAFYTMDAWLWFDRAVQWSLACPDAIGTTGKARLYLPLTQRK